MSENDKNQQKYVSESQLEILTLLWYYVLVPGYTISMLKDWTLFSSLIFMQQKKNQNAFYSTPFYIYQF